MPLLVLPDRCLVTSARPRRTGPLALSLQAPPHRARAITMVDQGWVAQALERWSPAEVDARVEGTAGRSAGPSLVSGGWRQPRALASPARRTSRASRRRARPCAA